MKQGKTLVELAQTLENLSTSKVDLVAHVNQMKMTDDGAHIAINAEHLLEPTKTCHNQIAERLGIPVKYYDKMAKESPKLLADNVNTWFGLRDEKRMIRSLGTTARAFLSDRYHRIDNEHVMEVVLPLLMESGKVKVQSCEVTENRMYIKATATDIVVPVRESRRVGDLVEAGVLISNSEIGMGSLNIQPFMHFLACTNGMVRNKLSFVKYHVGRKNDSTDLILSDTTKSLEDAAILSRVKDVIKACLSLDLLQKEVELMELAQQQKITGDVPKAVEYVGEVLQLNQAERSGVLRHLIEGGDLSRYAMMNAVTRTAQDLDSYDRATELEELGGRVLDLPKKDWTRIAEATA